MTRFVWLLLTTILCVVSCASGVRVANIPCNGIVPIDSQYNLDPLWSLAWFRNRIVRLSGGAMSFSQQAIEKNQEQLLAAEYGMNAGSTLVFEITPTLFQNPAQSDSFNGAKECTVLLDPLLGGMDGLTSRSARFTVLSASDANNALCSLPVTISLISSDRKSETSLSFDYASTAFSHSISLNVDGNGTWPLSLSFSSQCTLRFILLVDRFGAINRWYVWIPTTVYTAVVVALFLPAMAMRRQLPVHLAGLFLFLVFLGYLGSCIGLVVELLQWQSSLGRMFPFPPSVTLYSCLCVLYVLLLLPVLYRQGNNTVLFMGAARLLTYGINCALCVGYWIAGYVVLGSLAVLQLLVTNIILTWYYAYVSVHLRRAVRGTSSLPKFSNNFLYLWCVPVTPFACCALMYYDLYLLAQRDVKKDTSALRMRDVVRVYNAQMSLPLLFFQNVYGIALLATATAFHMPFVVLLFVALLLWAVHCIYAVEQYVREWLRWHRSGGSLDTCGRVSLSAVMKSLLSNSAGEAPLSPPMSQGSSQAVTPSPLSMRRRGRLPQYEEDVAAYRERQLSSSTSSDGDSFEERSHRRPRRQIPDQATAFSTPSRQNISNEPEYWPSSVER